MLFIAVVGSYHEICYQKRPAVSINKKARSKGRAKSLTPNDSGSLHRLFLFLVVDFTFFKDCDDSHHTDTAGADDKGIVNKGDGEYGISWRV
ncbi:MAG TPA: hypothetical protein VGN53_15900 [Klebsiella sp.]|jgi:hypothetical protein